MSCGVGHRGGSDPKLLWLCCRPAAASPVPPLAWELPYALGAAFKKTKKKKEKNNSLYLLTPNSQPIPLPLGNHKSVLHVHESTELNSL